MKWIAKKYEIVRSLGGGAFSDVYLVKSPESEVALKLLKTEITMKPSERNLICFKNEFSILKNLNHPNIAKILDFGLDEELMQYYFTAELVGGDDIFAATTNMDVATITDLFVQALRALEYLHSYRIFHFDIKAANLLVTQENKVKLIDFGLASLDPKGKVMGTPSYMAPEIVRGEKPDGRADIYSLGVLFYYCLTKKNPFRVADPKATLENQKVLIPPPPSKYNKEIPQYIDQIIKRMLEKRPDNRYEFASQIITELNLLGNLNIATETSETLLSYIPEKGRFIGRKKECELIKKIIADIKDSKIGYSTFVISGNIGTGKKRLLDEVKYYSQLNDIGTESADGHNILEVETWLEKMEEHLKSGEGAKTFLLYFAEWLEATPYMIARIKNTLAKIPVYSKNDPTIMGISIDSKSKVRDELTPLVDLHIELGNFNRDEFKEYLTNVTGLEDVPDFLPDEILKRTDGNPLFITEIIKSLITSGSLFDSKGRWKKTSFIDLGVDFKKIFPESLKSLLMDSFYELEPDEKKILEFLSVASRPASSYEILRWTNVHDLGNLLEKLIRKDMLVREAPYNYYFRNALLAGYIYEELPTETKGKYHDTIANQVLQTGGSSDEVARHFGAGSDHKKGFEIAFATGINYLKEGLGKKAIEYFTLSLKNGDAIKIEEVTDLHMKLGEAYLISQDYKNALHYFNLATKELTEAKDKSTNMTWQIDNLIKIGGTYIKLNEFGKARQSFSMAKKLLNKTQKDRARKLIIENFEGYLFFQEGKLDEAKEIYIRTRAQWMELPKEQRSKVTNNELGMLLIKKGEPENAIAVLKGDIIYFNEIKDELLIARCYYNMAVAYQDMGNLGEATAHFEKSAEISRNTKDIELLLCAYNGLGNIFNMTAQPEKSMEYYKRAKNLSLQTNDYKNHAAISINIGIIENNLGHSDLSYYELYPAILYLKNTPEKSIFDWQILCRGEMEMAAILIKKGDFEAAKQTIENAKESAKHLPKDETLEFWLLWTEARLYKATGATDLFSPALEKLADMAKTAEEKNAIENLTEFPEDEMEKTYRAILEINKVINSGDSLSSILKLILGHALELSGAESSAIVLRSPMGELYVAAHRNLNDETWDANISYSFAREAIQSDTIIESENAVEDPRFSSEKSVKKLCLKSVLCVPIYVKNHVKGVLYLDHRARTSAFKGVHKDILKTFSDQIGIAIDNAQKIEDLSARSREMESQIEVMSSQLKQYEDLIEGSVHGFITQYNYENIVGKSKAMSDLLQTVDKITDTDISVLITGESGTGKELVARALHFNSTRKGAKFVTVNCGAIPTNLMESELFGYKAGAFTGATHDKKGLFEEADGGTIFLDEVTEIESPLQVKLLRIIQEKEFTRVGDTKPRQCNVRIISATNKDIDKEKTEGRFREDLYWRICQIKLYIPALRERREDIPLLVKHFLNKDPDSKAKKISSGLLKIFMEYDWPGNIRELESMISVASALSESDTIDEKCIPASYNIHKQATREMPPPEKLTETQVMIDDKNYYDPSFSWNDYENLICAKAYLANNFRARPTARELGISPTTLYNKLKACGLEDKNNPVYKNPFHYTRGTKLKSYTSPIFKAALKAANNRATKAISRLKISQGFFYKVMKKSGND